MTSSLHTLTFMLRLVTQISVGLGSTYTEFTLWQIGNPKLEVHLGFLGLGLNLCCVVKSVWVLARPTLIFKLDQAHQVSAHREDVKAWPLQVEGKISVGLGSTYADFSEGFGSTYADFCRAKPTLISCSRNLR